MTCYCILHVLVLASFIFWVSNSASTSQVQLESIYGRYGLHHAVPNPAVKADSITVFIHAAVGIFPIKRKRPGQTRDTWGYGREIMDEMLVTLEQSGLLTAPGVNVYVTLLGNRSNVALALATLQEFNSSGNVRLIIQGSDLYVSELPTIHAIHTFAKTSHPRSAILYLHTKGMRNNGQHSADWRRYMVYFLVERRELCLEALFGRQFDTCGVQQSAEEFEGNMWWATARWIADLPGVGTLQWNMANRYEAEDFLMKPSIGKKECKSYCLFRIPHNLYDCQTPREMYSNDTFSLRQSPVCYIPDNIVPLRNDKGRSCHVLKKPG